MRRAWTREGARGHLNHLNYSGLLQYLVLEVVWRAFAVICVCVLCGCVCCVCVCFVFLCFCVCVFVFALSLFCV